MPTITFEHVHSFYEGGNDHKRIQALNDFCAVFENRKIHAITGENGSGKSTLLKCLCDFQPYEGHIFLEGKDVADILTKDRHIGYVPQESSLNPKQNVFENISFPLMIAKKKAEEIRLLTYAIAKDLKISQLLNRKVSEISKGQAQRVSLAKALVKEPEVCLLDEPFANLDRQNKEIGFSLLRKNLERKDFVCLLVTHDALDALEFCDTITTLDAGRCVSRKTKAIGAIRRKA